MILIIIIVAIVLGLVVLFHSNSFKQGFGQGVSDVYEHEERKHRRKSSPVFGPKSKQRQTMQTPPHQNTYQQPSSGVTATATKAPVDQQPVIEATQQLISALPTQVIQDAKMGNNMFTQNYLHNSLWTDNIERTYQLWQSSKQLWYQIQHSINLGPSLQAKLPEQLPSSWVKQLTAFKNDCEHLDTGNQGEYRVAQYLKSADLHGHARILLDVNLPFRYKSSEPIGVNQIDALLISTHGIFALEIKNYSATAMSIEDINGIRRLYNENPNRFYDPHGNIKFILRKNNQHNEYIVYKTQRGKYIVADARFNSIGYQVENHRYALDRAIGGMLRKWDIKAMDTIHSPVVYSGPQIGNVYNRSRNQRVQIYIASQLATRLFHRYPRQVLLPEQVDELADKLDDISNQESQRDRVVITMSADEYHQYLNQWSTALDRLKQVAQQSHLA